MTPPHPALRVYWHIRAVLADAAAGYEPVMVRSVLAALFVCLAAFGLGSGDLPPQADAVLVLLTFLAPILAGKSARKHVTPSGRDHGLPSGEPPEDGAYEQ